MRRLRHHLFTMLSSVSLALCVAAVVLSFKSRHHFIQWFYHWPSASVGWHSFDGRCYVSHQRVDRPYLKADELGFHWYSAPPQGLREAYESQHRVWQSARSFAGIEVINRHDRWGKGRDRWMSHFLIGIPYTVLAAASVPLPLLWITRLLVRRRRGSRGRCRTCGYDLRASPDRCPECGTAVAK